MSVNGIGVNGYSPATSAATASKAAEKSTDTSAKTTVKETEAAVYEKGSSTKPAKTGKPDTATIEIGRAHV